MYKSIFINLEYYSGAIGGVCNYVSDVIRSKSECTTALQKLNYRYSATFWSNSNSGIPAGCSIRNGGDRIPHLETSTGGAGKGRNDLIPICKRSCKL